MKISSSFTQDKAFHPSHKGFAETTFVIPKVVGKIGKMAGEYISVPEQKLFLASTAFFLHPLIDLKFCEEDKKVDSAIKSASKAFVGGLTGVIIRGAAIKLAKNVISFDSKDSFLKKCLFPSRAENLKRISNTYAQMHLNKYATSIGTIAALLFMSFFSNKNVDVPLTSDMQDFIGGIVKQNKTWGQSFKDVIKNRFQKITNITRKHPKTDKTKNSKEAS